MAAGREYLKLQAQAKTGLTKAVAAWLLIAGLAGGLTLGFAVATAFIWLARRYDVLVAALLLAIAFLVIAIVAFLVHRQLRRRAVERAEHALGRRYGAAWLDPKMLALALEIGRALGARRIVPLLALGALAFGVSAYRHNRSPVKDEESGEPSSP
jgi:hypothetical protein